MAIRMQERRRSNGSDAMVMSNVGEVIVSGAGATMIEQARCNATNGAREVSIESANQAVVIQSSMGKRREERTIKIF